MAFNVKGTLKHNQLFLFSLLIAILLVVLLVNAVTKDLVSIDVFNLSSGTSSQGGGFVVSSTDGKLTNGSSLTYAAFDPTGLSRLNLSSIININVSLIANGSHGGYVNVTFGWILAKSNGSTMLNTTTYNSTFNRTSWNYSFNTNLLPDGIYNISVYVQNVSTDAAGGDSVINLSRGFDIAIDRTPPNVTQFLLNDSFGVLNASNFTSGGVVAFNLTINDSTLSVETVKVGLTNNLRNGTEFNITLLRNFSGYHAAVAFNTLTDGFYTLKVYANDSLGNTNNTLANLSFRIDNTPPNVTAATLIFGNYSGYAGHDGRYVGINLSAGLSEGNYTLMVAVNDTTTHPQMIQFNLSNRSGSVSGGGVYPFNHTAVKNESNYTTGPTGAASHAARGNFNVSRLAEGWYNLTVWTNDSVNNINGSLRMAFVIDRTLPSVSVTCSPSAVTAGQTVTCTCTVSDDYPGSGKLSGAFEGGGTSESTTATGSSGTSSTCRGVDYAGNVRTATASWTVTAASSGGGGGGGSGGGSSSGIPTQFEKKVWTSINAGETATVEVDNSVIGVTEVSFSVAETTYGAWVQVKKVDSLPSSVEAPETVVYRTLEITQQNVQKALQGQATVKFKVEKSWLTDNSVSAANVALFRYVDGDWAALPTTRGEDDGTYVHYSATTSGFSYFVIGEAEAVTVAAEEAAPVEEAVEEAPVEEAGAAEAPEGEAMVKKSNAAVWMVPLVVLIIIGGLLYWYWQRK